MCTRVCLLEFMETVCVQEHKEAEEDAGCPGTGLTDLGTTTRHQKLNPNPGSLQEPL